MPEDVLLAGMKALGDKLEAHGTAVKERVDGVLSKVTGLEDRLKVIEVEQAKAIEERKEILQRIPTRGAGGVPSAIVDALHHQAGVPEERRVMNEQAKAIMACLLTPPNHERPVTGEQLKALQVGIGASGGFLIPRAITAEIIQKATLRSIFLAYADIVDPAELTGATNRENGDFTWSSTAELAQPTETTFATLLNQLTWTLTNQAAFATVSNRLLKYAPVDMANFLTDKAGRSFQAKADDWFVNGTGSGEPRGLRIGENVNSYAQAGTTVGSFDWTDLVELEASLGIAYRGEAVVIMNDTGRKLVAKLATTTGEPVFMGVNQMAKLGLTTNYKTQSGMLNLPGGVSYPYFLVSGTALPSNLGAGANASEIWFGVPRLYRIWIGENMEMSQDSSGPNWRVGQTQLKFSWDGDGAVLLGEAWSKLTGVL